MNESFWKRVAKSDDPDGCWLWTGPRTVESYPLVHNGERTVSAHRLVWESEHGPVPVGHVVARRCGERLCVRPGHLEMRHPGKLDPEQVHAIRRLWREGHGPTAIARVVGTRVYTVWQVTRNRAYYHVPEEAAP